MDEFELFRAQAYSGGVLSDRSTQYLLNNDDNSLQGHSTSTQRRRHSSVGLGQTEVAAAAAGPPDPSSSHRGRQAPPTRRHRMLAGSGAPHPQSLDYGGGPYDVKDAVVANVTVAIEPPSPTETRRQRNFLSPSASASTASPPSAASHRSCQYQLLSRVFFLSLFFRINPYFHQ